MSLFYSKTSVEPGFIQSKNESPPDGLHGPVRSTPTPPPALGPCFLPSPLLCPVRDKGLHAAPQNSPLSPPLTASWFRSNLKEISARRHPAFSIAHTPRYCLPYPLATICAQRVSPSSIPHSFLVYHGICHVNTVNDT